MEQRMQRPHVMWSRGRRDGGRIQRRGGKPPARRRMGSVGAVVDTTMARAAASSTSYECAATSSILAEPTADSRLHLIKGTNCKVFFIRAPGRG